MRAHQQYHTEGNYFTIVFDAAPKTLPELTRQLQLDTRVLRATVIKIGSKLEEISGLPTAYLDAAGMHQGNAVLANRKRISAPLDGRVPFPGTENEWLLAKEEFEQAKVELPTLLSASPK
jgi:hypothetical protein